MYCKYDLASMILRKVVNILGVFFFLLFNRNVKGDN